MTTFPIAMPHAPTGFVTQADLDTAFTVPINDLAAQTPGGFEGEATSGTAVVLAAAVTSYIGAAGLTVTVPTGGRRYRAFARANFAMLGGTNGRYYVQPAYCPGSSIDRDATTSVAGGTVVNVGTPLPTVLTVVSGSLTEGQQYAATVFLAAGVYTFCVAVQRQAGGGATDVAGTFQIQVDDIGPS